MSPRVVRCLALAALALPAAILLTPARAQVGPPPGFGGMRGGPAGGIGGGMPPGPPAGIGGGMPGPFQGGMAGQPGGIGGGGIGGGAMDDEWVCSRCGAVIGHGPIKPAWMICPRCGARFTDGPGDPDLGPPGGPNIAPPPVKNGAPSSSNNRTVLIVVTVGVGVLIILGVLGAVIYFNVARTGLKETPRRRRRSVPRRAARDEFPPDDQEHYAPVRTLLPVGSASWEVQHGLLTQEIDRLRE
jgi:hypothetical protein